MTLLDILLPQSPPEPTGARVVTFEPAPAPVATDKDSRYRQRHHEEVLRKARARWARNKDARNAKRRAAKRAL